MRRAPTAARALTLAASLVAACLTTTAATAAPGATAVAAPQATGAPADGRIAFNDFGTGQIYAVNPNGTALTQLTHEPSGIVARWPAWSPDGSGLLFVRWNPANGMGRIWTMNADGTGQRPFASDAPGYRDYQPRYTPDGRRIVFARCAPNDGLCAIWIMRADGTHRRLVIPFIEFPNETNDFDPAVSPDGRHLTFTRFGFNGIASQVWVADISGAHAHPLTAPRLEAFGAAWSPDGTHIAFASNSTRPQSAVYVMRADGTDVTRLAATKWPANSFGPAYAPGGDQIAFASDRLYPDLCCVYLFLMQSGGSQQHPIATGLQGVIDIGWGTAPLVPAGSPGTLGRPPASVRVPGAAHDARCHLTPAGQRGQSGNGAARGACAGGGYGAAAPWRSAQAGP